MGLGEVVTLGRHRLLCGDAFNAEHVDALLQGEKPAMLYCDPPYGLSHHDPDKRTERSLRRKDGTYRIVRASTAKTIIGDAAHLDFGSMLPRFDSITEQFWWGADYYAEKLPNRNDGSWIVWDKRGTIALDAGIGSCFELCWSKQRHKRDIARIPWSGFIGIREEPDGKRHHPTQKPVRLAEWFISRYSKEGDIVCDLFGGAGGTLLACERLNRRCFMAEISPDYCAVIIERYQRLAAQPSLFEASA